MLDQLTFQSFEPHVGSQFQLEYAPDESIVATLSEASKLGQEPPAGQRQAFSLLFAAPADPPLDQQMYRVTHEELGELELFLVPVNQTDDGQRWYEAVFN